MSRVPLRASEWGGEFFFVYLRALALTRPLGSLHYSPDVVNRSRSSLCWLFICCRGLMQEMTS